MLAYSSTHILAFIVTNLFFYSGIRCTVHCTHMNSWPHNMTILMTATFSAFYLTMKLLWGERPTNWVKILLKSFRPGLFKISYYIYNQTIRHGLTLFALFFSLSQPWAFICTGFDYFSPLLALIIIYSSRNKNQDLGAAESR